MGNSSVKEDHSSLYNLIKSIQTQSEQYMLFPDRNIRLIKIATIDNQSRMHIKLQQKKNNHSQHISKVLNFVEAPYTDTLCSRVKTYYILVQNLQYTLLEAINKKVQNNIFFQESQIWNFLNQAATVINILKKNGNAELIFSLNNIFVKENGHFCINDPELFEDFYQGNFNSCVEKSLGDVAFAMATLKVNISEKQGQQLLFQKYSTQLAQTIHKLKQGSLSISEFTTFLNQRQFKSLDSHRQSLSSTTKKDRRKKLSLTLKEDEKGKENFTVNQLLLSVDLHVEGGFTFNGKKEKKNNNNNQLKAEDINHCFPKAKLQKRRLSNIDNKYKIEDTKTAEGTLTKNSIYEDIQQLNDTDQKSEEQILFSSYRVHMLQNQNTFKNISNIKYKKAKPYKKTEQQIQVTEINTQHQYMLDLLSQHKDNMMKFQKM